MKKINLFFFCLLFLGMACNANKVNQTTRFEIYQNKHIVPSVYWYFDIESGEQTVFKIETLKEEIFFEVAGPFEQFDFTGEKIALAKIKIITNDNRCFLGESGHLKGKLNGDQLDIDIQLNAKSPKSNIQAESILTDKKERMSYDLSLKGTVSRK